MMRRSSPTTLSAPLLLCLFSITALVSAYTTEYGFGFRPCHLCLYQRIPFFIVLPLSIIGLLLGKRSTGRLLAGLVGGILLLVGAGIATYHVGVEQGIIIMETSCSDLITAPAQTLEAMRQQLLATPGVPCDKPQFMLLGLSMAAWNMLLSSVVGCMAIGMAWKQERI